MNNTVLAQDTTESMTSISHLHGLTQDISNSTGDLPNTDTNSSGSHSVHVPDSNEHILNALVVLSALTVLVNSVVIIMSKYANGGKSSTFVFLRSLCLADMLIGMFGIFKCILLKNLEFRIVNCFLPESIFISASTVICVTLLWLNIDSYLRLSKPLSSINFMDKHSVIITMVLLWNMAFVVGFAPLMGWNNQYFVCDLFQFYTTSYALFVALIWLTCIVGSCMTHIFLHRTMSQIRENNRFVSPKSLEFLKYAQLTPTIRNNLITTAICYPPLIAYLFYFYTNQRHNASTTANLNLIYFMPVFLARSLLTAFIHVYRTILIQRVLRDISKRINVPFLRTFIGDEPNSDRMSRCNSLAKVDQNGLQAVSVLASDTAGTKPHRPLCTSDSTVTILSESSDSETTSNTNTTKL